MWWTRIALLLFVTGSAQWCGVTSEWVRKREAMREASRSLQEATKLARETTLGTFRIKLEYLDMSALTAQSITRLKNIILPNTVNWFSKVLSVYHLKDPLKISECSDFDIPAAHKTLGVPDADFVIYVKASNVEGTWIAQAGPCAYDGPEAPIAGTFEFNRANYKDNQVLWDEIGTARHEITHALVFVDTLYSKFKKPDGTPHTNPTIVETWRGKTRTLIATPKVVEKARAAFGCATLNGVELEDSGGEGTGGAHWEKRLMLNDYMVGAGSSAECIYSDITLAIFEDSGWYHVNYAYTDPISFGRGQGCNFFSKKCVDSGVSNFPEYFCTTEGQVGCDFARMSVSRCNAGTQTSAIPLEYQYFSSASFGGIDNLADFCPYFDGDSDGSCVGRSTSPYSPQKYYGDKACPNCRCFTGNYIKTGYTDNEVHAKCHEILCENNVLSVIVGSEKVACPAAGGSVSISGFTGKIDCPAYERLCVDPKPCPNGCQGVGKCVKDVCVCDDGFTGLDCSVTCSPSCRKCGATPTQCTACYDHATLLSASCSCDGGYALDASTKKCIASSTSACHATCLTCNGPAANQCKTCRARAKVSSSGFCECAKGFYLTSDGNCDYCATPCATCNNKLSCLTCNDNAAVVKDGKCTCPDGFFANVDGTQCSKCHYSCKTCNGSGSGKCLTCNAKANFSRGTCSCSPKYFMDPAGTCKACAAGCAQCSSATQCSACKYTSMTLTGGQCSCATHQYLGASGCLECDAECSTCAGPGNDQCTSCPEGKDLADTAPNSCVETRRLQASDAL